MYLSHSASVRQNRPAYLQPSLYTHTCQGLQPSHRLTSAAIRRSISLLRVLVG